MPARRKPSDQKFPPVPLPDTEAILRAGRREQHLSRPNIQIARQAAAQPPPAPLPSTPARNRTDAILPATPPRIRTSASQLPPLPESDSPALSSLPSCPSSIPNPRLRDTTTPPLSPKPFATMAENTTQPAPDASNSALMKAIVDSQLTTNERMAKLEDFMMKMMISKEAQPPATTSQESKPVSGIDLTKFRTSDGPVYKGPYHETEPFLRWYTALKTFYRTKGVVEDKDRIILVGSFLEEANAHAFYEGNFDSFLKGSWKDFLKRLFAACLPADWKDRLHEKAQHLKMSPYEDFKTYST